MKKDLKEEKLLDEQLNGVQGGYYGEEKIVSFYCVTCYWSFSGYELDAPAARRAHTNDTGHTRFANQCGPV